MVRPEGQEMTAMERWFVRLVDFKRRLTPRHGGHMRKHREQRGGVLWAGTTSVIFVGGNEHEAGWADSRLAGVSYFSGFGHRASLGHPGPERRGWEWAVHWLVCICRHAPRWAVWCLRSCLALRGRVTPGSASSQVSNNQKQRRGDMVRTLSRNGSAISSFPVFPVFLNLLRK